MTVNRACNADEAQEAEPVRRFSAPRVQRTLVGAFYPTAANIFQALQTAVATANSVRLACVYRKLDPDVLMMKSAENGM